MFKNTAGQKWEVLAWDSATGLVVSGVAASITANIRIDDNAGAPIASGNPTELERGYYAFALSQAETNGNKLLICPVASGTNQVIGCPPVIFTQMDIARIGGDAQSLIDLKDFVDSGYDPSTHKVEDVKIADNMRGTDNAALASGVNITKLNGDIQSLADLKDFADAGYDPTTHKLESVKIADNMRGTDNAALETTLTAIKGVGWSTETLKEINTSIGAISISGGDASSAKQDIIIGKIEDMQDHGDIYWVASGTVSGSTTIKNLRYCEVLHAGIYHDVMIGVADLDNVDTALQTWALAELGEYLDLPSELIKNQNLNDLLTSKEINTSVYVDA